MANHGVVAFLGTAAVDVAIASTHGTLGRSEIGPQGIEYGVTKGEAAGLVADERGEDILLLQENRRCGAEGFLPLAEKHPALDHPSTIEASQLVFGGPSQKHNAVGADEEPRLVANFRRCLFFNYAGHQLRDNNGLD